MTPTQKRAAQKKTVQKRATKQRAAVARALDDADGFRTAQELHDQLRSAGEQVGLTTVYRTLQLLSEEGTIDVLRAPGGDAIYRRCDSDEHHHHLVCKACGATVEIESDEIERWAAKVATRHGFTSVDHLAELYGTCGECSG